MSAGNFLPETTSQGVAQSGGQVGITNPPLTLPSMPAVNTGGQNYENRVTAMESLNAVANGSLRGGGRGGGRGRSYRIKRKMTYKRRGNHNITKVMKGCNNNKTRKSRHSKNKKNNKRIFRGGSNITPATTSDNKIQIPIPGGASADQINTLKELSGGLFQAQVTASNVPPEPLAPVESKFSGGGMSRRKMSNHRRIRYKKSIGRKCRSRRYGGRR
jgi:hypothetical protein